MAFRLSKGGFKSQELSWMTSVSQCRSNKGPQIGLWTCPVTSTMLIHVVLVHYISVNVLLVMENAILV